MTTNADLLAVANGALDIARELFLRHRDDAPAWREKTDRDPVSVVDETIESTVREYLEQHSPGVPFFGEEYGGDLPSDRAGWVLDPVDGTVNYLQGSPLCGISLGLVDGDSPLLGVVDLPLLGERYQGGQGIDVTLNGRAIAPAQPSSLRESVVAIGDYSVGASAHRKNGMKLAVHARLAECAYRVRMLGSAAIDLVWVAAGRHGATVTLSNNVWDMAAGVAIARAAGVHVLGGHGQPYALSSDIVVTAATEAVAEQLRDIVAAAMATSVDGEG